MHVLRFCETHIHLLPHQRTLCACAVYVRIITNKPTEMLCLNIAAKVHKPTGEQPTQFWLKGYQRRFGLLPFFIGEVIAFFISHYPPGSFMTIMIQVFLGHFPSTGMLHIFSVLQISFLNSCCPSLCVWSSCAHFFAAFHYWLGSTELNEKQYHQFVALNQTLVALRFTLFQSALAYPRSWLRSNSEIGSFRKISLMRLYQPQQ